jgi:transposase
MVAGSRVKKHSEDFKRQIVELHRNGKTYRQIQAEYGVHANTVAEWIRKYSEVKMPDDTIMTAQEVERLRKRNAELEEENIILKKAAAIFMQHSKKD